MVEPKKKEWWEDIFDDRYLATYVDIATPAATDREVSFIIEKLKPKKDGYILDLACGYGRHSIALAERGYKVTGVDYSSDFITQAKEEAKKRKLEIEFLQDDMRKITFNNRFDIVLSLFTSFGYFTKEEDHKMVLKNISQSLKRNGIFLLDLTNAPPLLNDAILNCEEKADSIYEFSRTAKLSNGLEVATQHRLDAKRMRWHMRRSWQENSEKKSYNTSVRLFTLPDITSLMEENSLFIEQTWGDFNGAPYTMDSKRMIISAKKK